MTPNPICCAPHETAEVAVWRMRRHDCGALPVVDGADRPIGMVTDRDVALIAERTHLPLTKVRIADAMSPAAFSCHVDDRLEEVDQEMRRRQVRRMPVVDSQHQIVGIIGLSDLSRIARPRPAADEPPDGTLAAIAEPSRASRGD